LSVHELDGGKIILVSQLMEHIQAENNQHPLAVVELKSEILKNLSPILPPALERLRAMSASYGVAGVLDQLVSLGQIVGLYGPEE
jgi:hypothetical protein